MYFPRVLAFLLFVAFAANATNDDLTTAVEWDKYSLLVNGKRVYVFAGEFHYARLPVPELWRDVLQKYKSNGLNAVSVYFFWSFHSPSKDVFDFSTPARDVQYFLDLAKEVGLYVIARPGPYCNAETNGGGLALWGSDGSLGKLRTSDETYHQAWLPWITAIGELLAKNQVTQGGNVILHQIENELRETRHSATDTLVLYMVQIETATRNAGIVVPFTHNEKGERSMSWSTDYENVGGAVNVYGLDSYPGGLSCTNINTGFNVVRNYYQWFQNYSYTQPQYLAEFEAGYLQRWGTNFYDRCLTEHDPAFADVFYKNNIGQRVTLQNLYIAFGGTNWGNLGAPVVYTSYGMYYSAPLRETREVEAKFKQTKLISLFTRVSQDLLKTAMESNGTGNAVSSESVYSWVIRNVDNRAGFYTLQQSTTSSRNAVTFDVYLDTSIGPVTVPNVQLNGRQSKIVTTDYHFGDDTLLYCSADILTYALLDVRILVLYLEVGQVGEFAFKDESTNRTYTTYGLTKVSSSSSVIKGSSENGAATFNRYTYTQAAGSTMLQFSDGLLIYLLDLESAWNFYALPTTSDPNVSPSEHIVALGPYNIRNASLSGDTVTLIGDNANLTSLEVYAGAQYSSITWNGQALSVHRTRYGSLFAIADGAADRTVGLPELTWVVADSLPEANRDYDDSRWVVANKASTLAPTAPLSYPVLFSSDYGFYPGIKLYRGYFDGTAVTAAKITVQGGAAAGWSAYLNGQYVGGHTGNASLWTTSALLDLSSATKHKKSNVLTVVTDYTGHDQTSTSDGVESPRGILGAFLYAGKEAANFTEWKIQGNAGGSSNIDPVRGSLNEDGLYGTRLGWHLPGFKPDGADWSAGSPLQGLNRSGVAWYISRFSLSIDADLDVPLGIELDAAAGTEASVQLYVNGYQYGKYIPQIGPQTRFPFPPGIINNRGENTIALSLWAQTDAGAKLTKATLFAYNKYQTGVDFANIGVGLQPGWTKDRLQYI
ncbi:glycoside hydrolase family 35 protein [Teratosphaeria destructans]|uniref:beta-galactosidase n=1 Tax=Teratosphaeria destructans TaxID=418781 RepID=A0A9W7SK59_9PEZI|nr:glycoside hydrolase family 35 protein [Teratosphaeria destructans]